MTTYLDWVSPDLMRSLRTWNLLLPHQSDQLMIVSFSQRSFTIIRSPMSTSVVMRKDIVVLPFRTGLWGEKRSSCQLDCPQGQGGRYTAADHVFLSFSNISMCMFFLFSRGSCWTFLLFIVLTRRRECPPSLRGFRTEKSSSAAPWSSVGPCWRNAPLLDSGKLGEKKQKAAHFRLSHVSCTTT